MHIPIQNKKLNSADKKGQDEGKEDKYRRGEETLQKYRAPRALGTRKDGAVVKNLLPMQEIQETRVQSLSQEDPLEKEMATHFSILPLGNLMDRGAW